MKLNHLSLSVPDVTETTDFFETYFNFRCLDIKGEGIIAVLEGADSFVLVLTRMKSVQPYPADFHFGFILDTPHEVEELHNRLLADGYNVPDEPRKIRNSYAFYFHIPGGIMAEISCNL